jgi:glycosyltransferase involved in cell wall biosynthesis
VVIRKSTVDPVTETDAPAGLPVARTGLPAGQAQSDKVKVLHIITRFMDGSGGNTLLSAIGVDARRYDVWIAGSPAGSLWERAIVGGVTPVKLSRLREVVAPLDDFIVLRDLVRLIRRERFAVVHTHSSKAGFLGRLAAWLCRTPVIVHTIHGFSWHDYMSARRRRAYLALERFVGRMTDEFFAVSPQVAREAVDLRMAAPGSVSVIPSAIELDRIPDGGDSRARSELEIPPEVPLVGTVGRLDFQKAPLDFVRMAAAVRASRPDAHFVWVGEGPLLEDAQAEARRHGIEILFTGYRPDAPRLAACFDVYVVCSLYEGLGRGLSEALASGRPVVATAVNGVVDIVEPGSTGLLAPPADPETLGRKVTWLLDHPDAARRMGEAGRLRARALFEPSLMCRLIEQSYARLLGLPADDPVETKVFDWSLGRIERQSRNNGEVNRDAIRSG